MLCGGGNASRNLESPRNVGIDGGLGSGTALKICDLFREKLGNPGMRFCIPGMIFQEHTKHTWMGSVRYRRFGVG